MVSKGALLSFHGVVCVGALALALWAGAAQAAARYDTATPYSPPYNRYKYIPMHSGYDDFESSDPARSPVEDSEPESSGTSVPEFILSALRTALEVVRNMNKQRAASHSTANSTPIPLKRKTIRANNTAAVSGRDLNVIESNTTEAFSGRALDSNGTAVASGRGLDEYYDEHQGYGYGYSYPTTTPKPIKQSRYTDPWAGYYDWIINEGSFKFWSVFQLFTAALLLYACLSAIYYAKFNPILPDYSMEYDDYFLERTVGRKARSLESSEMPSGLSWINPRTFQFILDAISNHYSEES